MIRKMTDMDAPEIRLYSERSERILAHYLEPEEGYFIAESPNVIRRALAAGYEPVSFLTEEEQLYKEDMEFLQTFAQIPVYAVPQNLLKQIIGYQLTRGLLCLMRRKKMPDAMELCQNFQRIVVLEDVVNPTNVGAIFRSAAALGMDGVLLTKGCSDPLYRRAARVSMGTVFQIPWTWLDGDDWQQQIQEQGVATVAMALRENSLSLEDPLFTKISRLAVIMGTEGEGLREETIRRSSYTVRIPMTHGVDSLNVAAASAVAFWQLGRR